jgi:hypothetical protein
MFPTPHKPHAKYSSTLLIVPYQHFTFPVTACKSLILRWIKGSQCNAPISCDPGHGCWCLISRTHCLFPTRDGRVSLLRLPDNEAGPAGDSCHRHQRLRQRPGGRTEHGLNRSARHFTAHCDQQQPVSGRDHRVRQHGIEYQRCRSLTSYPAAKEGSLIWLPFLSKKSLQDASPGGWASSGVFGLLAGWPAVLAV